MEYRSEYKNISSNYELCFNESCELHHKCMHYQAYLHKPENRCGGPAVYPSAWKDGTCRSFREDKPVQMAWGFSRIYDNVPHHLTTEARRCVMNYFSSGCGPYYRYHHGEQLLSPRQQEDIMNILARYGSTDGLAFDHYVTAYDFT